MIFTEEIATYFAGIIFKLIENKQDSLRILIPFITQLPKIKFEHPKFSGFINKNLKQFLDVLLSVDDPIRVIPCLNAYINFYK